MSRVFTVEVEDPRSRVLAVTNLWPDVERPVYGIFVKRQVESLRKFGIYVDVLYVRGKASGLAYPRAAVSMAIKGLQARRRYELVHVHAGETGLAARFLLGVPMLISYLGDDLLGDPRANGTLKPRSVARSWVIRQHSRFFSATITKSAEMEHVLPSRVRERNIVLPNGVDPDLFRPLDQDNCRGELGWGLDERLALFVGDPAIERKRFWLAEAAHARAQEELGPIRLHVATTVSPD